ncbi:MAG: thiamine diphosphokinase [Bacillota bacterium]|jgi:thiamine pyrophosphokinase|nr:thiamine diphosphokinase [Candidatus Fermentithermobacillaceae bacterium]
MSACTWEDGTEPTGKENLCPETGRRQQPPWNHATRVKHNPTYAVVVAGGSKDAPDKALFDRASLVVAADSGCEFLKHHNMVPDVVVGDFDSSQPETVAHFRLAGCSIISLAQEKDKTDTEVALDLIASRGYGAAIVIGATGGKRLDHELANVFLIEHYAKRGLDLILHSEDTVIFGVSGVEYPFGIPERVFSGNPGDWVTVIPLTPQLAGVNATDLKYRLDSATLRRGSTLGVSNEMLGTTASISVRSGFALVVLNRR